MTAAERFRRYLAREPVDRCPVIEWHLYSFYDEAGLYHRICDEYAEWLSGVFDYMFSRFRFDFMTFAEDMTFSARPDYKNTGGS